MSKFGSLALAVEKPARMILVHPQTRQPLRDRDSGVAYIEIYSADSAVARNIERTSTDRRLATRGRAPVTSDQIEGEAVETLAGLTAGWRLVGLDGAPIDVPFNEANARELYAEPALRWIREQVDQFAVDRGNFTQASPRS